MKSMRIAVVSSRLRKTVNFVLATRWKLSDVGSDHEFPLWRIDYELWFRACLRKLSFYYIYFAKGIDALFIGWQLKLRLIRHLLLS
jgi:hypothetical protein